MKRILMLVAIVAAGCHKAPPQEYAGQSALAGMTKVIHEQVHDTATAARVIALVDSAQRLVGRADSATARDLVALVRANAQPETTTAELGAIFDRIDARSSATVRELIALQFRAKGLTTPAEWKAITDHEAAIVGQPPTVPADARY